MSDMAKMRKPFRSIVSGDVFAIITEQGISPTTNVATGSPVRIDLPSGTAWECNTETGCVSVLDRTYVSTTVATKVVNVLDVEPGEKVVIDGIARDMVDFAMMVDDDTNTRIVWHTYDSPESGEFTRKYAITDSVVVPA